MSVSDATERLVRVSLFPLYSHARHYMRAVQGLRRSAVLGLLQSVHDQMGTPQNPVDWSRPDDWITERLSGEQAELAWNIWQSSQHNLNPRRLRGSYYLCQSYQLLTVDGTEHYLITARGQGFVDNDPETIRELDRAEGLIALLEILSTKSLAQRSDMLPEWSGFLTRYSNFTTESTHKDTLYRRLSNLVERQLVSRDDNKYVITQTGISHLAGSPQRPSDPKRPAIAAIQELNHKQREVARRHLSLMDPYRFEQLVGQLLVQMGYEDVEVTKQSGDRGVDVVGTVQFGITTIKEVVQVKRIQSNIQRQVLDQLRGALPYYGALRGTLITLGDFSKGCAEAALFPGAAPITLINGDRLLDLMMEHQVGFTVHEARLMEFDEQILSPVVDPQIRSADTPVTE